MPQTPRARATKTRAAQALRHAACAPLPAPGTCACGAPADIPFTPLGTPMGYACERAIRVAMPAVQGTAGLLVGALAGAVARVVSGPQAVASVRSVAHDVTAMLVGGLQTAGAHGMLARGQQTASASEDPVARALHDAMASTGWRGSAASAEDVAEPRVEVDVTPRRRA